MLVFFELFHLFLQFVVRTGRISGGRFAAQIPELLLQFFFLKLKTADGALQFFDLGLGLFLGRIVFFIVFLAVFVRAFNLARFSGGTAFFGSRVLRRRGDFLLRTVDDLVCLFLGVVFPRTGRACAAVVCRLSFAARACVLPPARILTVARSRVLYAGICIGCSPRAHTGSGA